MLRCTRIRVDTTVVPSNVSYPTDSGLLAKAVNRIAATGRRIQAAGGAVRTKLRDRSRAAGRRAHDLNAKLRTRSAAARDAALDVVRRKNAEPADLAETAAHEAERLLANAKRALRKARADAAKLKAGRAARRLMPSVQVELIPRAHHVTAIANPEAGNACVTAFPGEQHDTVSSPRAPRPNGAPAARVWATRVPQPFPARRPFHGPALARLWLVGILVCKEGPT